MTQGHRIILLLIFTLTSMLSHGQSEVRSDNTSLNLESDTINNFFNSDSLDIFIQQRGCWTAELNTVINLRRFPTFFLITYQGGKPHRTMKKKIDTIQYDRIRKLLLKLPSQITPLDESPYLEVYLQTRDTNSKFAHKILVDYTLTLDKDIRKIIGLK